MFQPPSTHAGKAYGESEATQKDVDISDLASRVKSLLAEEPVYFAALAETFEQEGFKALSRALGELHAAGALW